VPEVPEDVNDGFEAVDESELAGALVLWMADMQIPQQTQVIAARCVSVTRRSVFEWYRQPI